MLPIPTKGRTIIKIERIIITTADNDFGHRHFSIRKMFNVRKSVYITNVPRKAPKIPRVAYKSIPPKARTIKRIIMFLSFWEKTGLFIQLIVSILTDEQID